MLALVMRESSALRAGGAGPSTRQRGRLLSVRIRRSPAREKEPLDMSMMMVICGSASCAHPSGLAAHGHLENTKGRFVVC